MFRRFSLHLVFLVFVAFTAIFLNWSAITAAPTLYNLIIVLPSGILVLALAIYITISSHTKNTDDSTKKESIKSTLSDLVLLALFAVFCLSLTTIGFDIATFVFVWLGIILNGERGLIGPPLFSAIFTFILIKGFGSLFPFPMPMLVF